MNQTSAATAGRPPNPFPDPVPDPIPGPAPLPGPQPDTPDEIPAASIIDMGVVGRSLRAGLRDFRRAPAWGLAFSGFYVAGGLVLAAVATAMGQDWWLMPFIVGFPLIAPFAAVGLYGVSRRLEAGEPLDRRSVLGVVFAQKDRQVPSMAMVILLLFMFWVFVAHTIFALFLGPGAMTNVSQSFEILSGPRGTAMLGLGTGIGAVMAAALFSITVVGLPMLLDREVDFISAIIASFEAVAGNPVVMLVWAAVIAVLLLAGMLPLFLGLFVVLPILGHASWHMYRELIPEDA
ncbi:DUF2189 domain-containing protein [Paracoccus sp. S-4012]|uniref:DUF2189 domain-containing protein n=1 Tax=Paracoccus sp. S-4012 TaxID=2665648 RepID=UPI0012B1150F|nr:DUF2189 domain-containing protein [Paracoccus sp. S-4012]MRX49064.1 DUF2189 domain-containing protein [Paracoccus sp. S-4012]